MCPTLFKVSRGRCGTCANVNAALRMRRLQKATAMLRVPVRVRRAPHGQPVSPAATRRHTALSITLADAKLRANGLC